MGNNTGENSGDRKEMEPSKSQVVSVVPNQSLVQARVVSAQPEPDGLGQTIELAVLVSRNVEGFPNFTRELVGRTVNFYLPEAKLPLRPGDKIEARTTYRAGRGSGRYCLLPDDIKVI
jgi:hypothetical protein